MVTIELTEADAKLFREFRQYQTQFVQLLDRGVFSDFVGKKVVHKDGRNIKLIETITTEKVSV